MKTGECRMKTWILSATPVKVSEHGSREGVAGYPLAGGAWLVEGATQAPKIIGRNAMKVMYRVVLMVAVVALLAISVPVPAFSQMMDMSMRGHGEGHGQMMEMGNMDKMGDMMCMCIEHADKMGLTDDQIMKMKPVHREMQKKQARFKADLRIAEIELMEIMEVKDFDLERASSAVKKIAEIKTADHLEMLKAMKKMRAILTDEQFKQMKRMMSMKMCP
jgi:Spy/CpxP family protein refolding chaperone